MTNIRQCLSRYRFISAAIFAVGMLSPLMWLAFSAFRSDSDILAAPYSIPGTFTSQNFESLARLPGFWTSLRNSLVVATIVACVTTVFGCLVGYLLTRYGFRGKPWLSAVVFCGYLLAPVMIVLPYFKFLSVLGMMNTWWGLVFAHFSFCMPLAVGLGTVVVQSTPLSLEEIATCYGCSMMRRLCSVVLPASRGNVIALFALVFIISWKEFFFAFVLVPAQNSRTLPVLLSVASAGDSVNWGLVCALSCVLAMPVLALPVVWRLSGKTGDTPFGGIRG